ncbi:MAG: hypothetical protein AB7O32_10505 [Vicinamibacterales bacterium]
MRRTTRVIAGIVAAVAAAWSLHGTAAAQSPHRCAGTASEQAARLLAFHLGSSDRIEIAPAVKTLAPIRNPADRRQRFDVLEVWGYVEKGQYRMRFLFARLPGDCLLMGQEILEHAAL